MNELTKNGNRRKNTEANECRSAAARFTRALSRKVLDPEDLACIVAVQEEAEKALVAAVANMRAGGMSWATIAAGLGVSRQAAQQRFGKRVADLAA